MLPRDEPEIRAHFEERYASGDSDAAALVEERAIGAVWGSNGYTTISQAEELHDHLALEPASRLLDVGTGRGWPGMYLAKRSGCSVVGTDLTVAGLKRARGRAGREGIGDRTAVVVASGVALPFAPQAFDAIVHSDVLC